MTAIIVSDAGLNAAVTIAGHQFSVPLSASGQAPATHWGCNWEGCPAAILDALAGVDRIAMAASWYELCEELALRCVIPQDP